MRRFPDERQRTKGLLQVVTKFVVHSQCRKRLSKPTKGIARIMPMTDILRIDQNGDRNHNDYLQNRLDATPETLQLSDTPSLNQADYHYYYRNHQQDVNQSTSGVGGGHSQRPQNQQNYANCPKHRFVPSRCTGASAGPMRRTGPPVGLQANAHTGGLGIPRRKVQILR